MRITNAMFGLLLILLSACSTTQPAAHKAPVHAPETETVMVTYHVKPGMEPVLMDLLAQAWVGYRKEHLVFAEPHTIIEDQDAGGKPRIIEIFTWVDHAAPARVPEPGKQLWTQMQSMCQSSNGHAALEGGEVTLLAPRNK